MAIDSGITTVQLTNLGAAQSNAPFTFGQVFAPGHLLPGDGLAADIAGADRLPLQVDVKALHADGSVRHAIVSGVLPTVKAGCAAALVKAAPLKGANAAALEDLVKAGLTSTATLTINGVVFVADLADVAKAAPVIWLSGPVVNEWIVDAPFKAVDGTPHPRLTARFGVRWYPGLDKQARVELVVENNKTWTPASREVYDVRFEVGGQVVYQKSALTHYHRARWHAVGWWDKAKQLALRVRHNTAYLIATKAIPNYDQSVVPSEIGLAALASGITEANSGPMTIGPAMAAMGGTGGREDIAPLPHWTVMYLLSGDPRAYASMIAAADGSGTWSVHYRDEKTGYPVRTDNDANKELSTHWNLSNRGPLPVPRFVGNDLSLGATPFEDDTAHTPSLVFVPYLLTGEYYYLEELHFWAAVSPIGTDPSYSGHGAGLLRWQQVRGQGWSLRTLGQAAYITPDAHPLKAYFTKQVDNNLDFYHATYVEGNPNNLGVYDGSGDKSYQITEIKPWMDDFFTWSFGYLADLGYAKAKPIAQWKSKFCVGRMTAPGYCWIQGAVYVMSMRPDDKSPIFKTFAELYDANFKFDKLLNDNGAAVEVPGVKYSELACGSQEQADYLGTINGMNWRRRPPGRMAGYADSTLGYPANMQPALALAVDMGVPNAKEAWARYASRDDKPNFSNGPQFDIVPRPEVAAVPTPVPAPVPAPAPAKPGKIKGPSNTKLAKKTGLRVTVFDPRTLASAKEFGQVAASSTGIISLSGPALVVGMQYALKVTDEKGIVLDIMFPINATA